MTLKSIIESVERRTSDKEKKKEEAAPSETPAPSKPATKDDEELQKIVSSLKAKIKIVGCGGAGCNTVNRIVQEGIVGANLYALNSDAQHLLHIRSPNKILIGRMATKGLGAGAVPRIGEEAALESQEEIRNKLQGSDLIFITAGMGGGTGTGTAPVVSRIARETGALTVGIVTFPFSGEGILRRQNAEYGLSKLEPYTDTVIVIPNDKLLKIVPKLPLNAAFKVADEILMRALKGLTEMITKVGLVNLDFADFKNIMTGGGMAMIGLGESSAHRDKAVEALNEAINSPLLDIDVSDAHGALVCVTGGQSMSVSEAEKVAEEIHSRINPNANIIWGAYIDDTLGDTMRVIIVLTGVRSEQMSGRADGSIADRSSLEIDMVR
ncbi:MAG: cell division protein FtsZ [Thermoplasmata archaeon]|nr:MAG: cell division protein FtsZ [Thermoplasmata archaeon]